MMKLRSYILNLSVLLLLYCATSTQCLKDDKQVTHPAVFYKEDYVNADYDPTVNLTNKENSLLKSEKLIFDYYPKHPRKLHGRHHKHAKNNNNELLRRTKRQTFNDPHGVFSEKEEETKSNSRQRRQYFQQPYQYNQQYNPYNPWNSPYPNSYYVTPNLVNYIPSNYYLPVGNNNPNKIPIRGIYHNPISVPGKAPINPKPQFSVGTRFGEDDYFEDRPVWGVRYENAPPRVSVTTRRPTTVSTPPPLLHGRPRTENTPPPLLHGRNRPTQAPPVITVNRPQETSRAPVTPAPTADELSKCVWAIVSCCSRDNPQIRYNCFEQMGCSGAFWGLNPCANDLQDRAIDVAENYFS